MPKRKRNSTWYRQFHGENNLILKKIFSDEKHKNEENSSNESRSSNAIDQGNFKSCGSFSISSSSSSSASCTVDAKDFNMSFEGSTSTERKQDFSPTISNQNIRAYDTVDKLKNWAVTNKIPHSALKELLNILREADSEDFSQLPKDPRTFLATPKNTVTSKVEPGEYCHIGIQNSLEVLYHSLNEVPKGPVNIAINIDGLPISKSSSSQFYPILGIDLSSKIVFMIYLFMFMEKMPWVVVKFLDSEEIEVIPLCWLHQTKDKTWYPNFEPQRVKKAIRNGEKPSPDWQTYNVKVLSRKIFEDFKFASAKASKCCEDSEATTEAELPMKRVSKRTERFGFESDSEGGDSESSLEFNTKSHEKNTLNDEQFFEGSADKISPSAQCSKQSEGEKQFKVECITILNKICRRINDIEKQLDTLNLNMEKILSQTFPTKKNEKTNEIQENLIKMFPIGSEENLQIAEDKLHNPQLYHEMVLFFERIGGRDFKDCLRRFMKRAVADNLAANYSLCGHKKKKTFSSLKLFSVVVDAVQICSTNTSKKEIELVTGQWLAKAPERLKKNTLIGPQEEKEMD